MKKVILFLLIISYSQTGFNQSIYNISFTNIDGASVSLSTYTGKKIILLLVPTNPSDTIRLDELKHFQIRFGDSVKIIGILSNEDGYSAANNQSIKNLYQSKGIDIDLTTGMYTKKSAGTNQSSLMKWLTLRDNNKRYGIDAQGIWQKFIVSRTGNLYAVVGPTVSLFDNAVGWALFRE